VPQGTGSPLCPHRLRAAGDSAGPLESLLTRLVRDSMGASIAVTPGIEHALSVSADAAAAAGESARAWQAQHAAWVNVGPCDAALPHADAPDRLAQAVANLRDVGLWPWVEGSAPRGHAL